MVDGLMALGNLLSSLSQHCLRNRVNSSLARSLRACLKSSVSLGKERASRVPLENLMLNRPYNTDLTDTAWKRMCCNFENGDVGRAEKNWAARFQAARSNSWSMN